MQDYDEVELMEGMCAGLNLYRFPMAIMARSCCFSTGQLEARNTRMSPILGTWKVWLVCNALRRRTANWKRRASQSICRNQQREHHLFQRYSHSQRRRLCIC